MFLPDNRALTPSDDSDIYSHIDNDEEEHLVKPSQLKKQNRFQQGNYMRNVPVSYFFDFTILLLTLINGYIQLRKLMLRS